MSRTTTYEIQVQFGDCDPAGIVFFPNFSKWMDAASLHFFMSCGGHGFGSVDQDMACAALLLHPG